MLNLSTTTYDNLPNIWFYELDWPARQVRRPGYLFFGLSDERSTAQPPRDFYVYFAPVFGRQAPPAPTEQDEALLALRAPDPAFVDTLRLYAGARALANESAAYREIYQDKAMGQGGFLRRLTAWLNENLAARLEATYEGETRPAREVLAGMRVAAGATDDLIRRLAAHLLEPWFEERYPDYPAFTELRDPISEAARPTAACEVSNVLTRGTRTALGENILRGLELLDDDGKPRPDRSRSACRYLGLLHAKPENQVVNRGEVIQPVGASSAGVIEKDTANGLEPEVRVAVVLLALVQNGDVTLTVDGKEALDAGNLANAALLAPGDLANFRHYARTKAVPVERWARIFEVLGLTAGLIRDETQREAGVRQLQDIVAAEQKREASNCRASWAARCSSGTGCSSTTCAPSSARAAWSRPARRATATDGRPAPSACRATSSTPTCAWPNRPWRSWPAITPSASCAIWTCSTTTSTTCNGPAPPSSGWKRRWRPSAG